MDTTARFGPIPTLPPNPGRAAAAGHRRAHSETFIRLPDDLFLDSEPDFFFADIESPSLSDDSASAPIPADSARSLPSPVVSGGGDGASHPFSGGGSSSGGGGHHLRSLSVDAAFFEELGLQGPAATGGGAGLPEGRPRHRHSSSMDGWTSPSEGESAPPDFAKKAMVADKMAELSLIDPKRAKRILANRQSAARSKERKIRYTNELERKVQTLQSEATTLSAQVTLLQRGTDGLTTENRELKLRLQAMEQQAHLHDALNEALREELQRLKIATGQLPNANGNTFNRGLQPPVSPFFSHPQQLHYLSGNQTQQVHTSQQSGDGPSFSDESLHDSMDFM